MRIISIHNGNVDPRIVEYQKKVFDYLGLEIEQIETTLQHAEALDFELNKWIHGPIPDNNDGMIAIFDIDCIPLRRLPIIYEKYLISYCNTLYGAAQQANHIPNSQIYAGPFFMAFHARAFIKAGCPSFVADEFGDVGYKLSQTMQHSLIWPIDVEVPKWNLGDSSNFGLGTTYGTIKEDGTKQPIVYHAFESRMGNAEMFVNKCKEVLDGKYK